MKQSIDSPKIPSLADIVREPAEEGKPDIVQKIAKEVTDTQKRIQVDRDEREKNIIIFNVPESDGPNSLSDAEFFKSMCEKTLKLKDTPEVTMLRLGAKKKDSIRPIKVSFQESWEKRKLLCNLFKLKEHKQYDMSQDDRQENGRLLSHLTK